jgi:tight adherence protein C
VSGVVASVAGALAVTVVLLLGLAARRPMARPLPSGGDRHRPARQADRRRRLLAVTAGVLGIVAVAVVGPMPVVLAAAAATGATFRRRRMLEVRRRRAVEEEMPDAVELLVLCVHAGRSPTQAVVELAARAPACLRDAFAAVELQLHRGRTLADALGELRRLAGPAGRDVASAIATAERDGLPLAPVLDWLATEARATRRRVGEAAARRLPVRLTFPLVSCTLPSFVLLAIAPAVLGAISTLRVNAP